MTLARVLETGNGIIEARLVIEGLDIELVSTPGMEKITPLDGRERVYCFDLYHPAGSLGLTIEESVNIPEAILEAPGTTIRLVERDDERLAQSFCWKPDQEWWIDQTIEIADTTITLYGTSSGLTAGDIVYVGTETMLVTNVAGLTVSVTRAYRQSIAQRHWSNEGGIARRTMHNRPLSIRGRRVYLYLYGDGDDLQAEGGNGGEPVWIGHVSGQPTWDDAGTLLRLQLASIAERLKGKLGGELDQPLVQRGIYYSWGAPIKVSLGENGIIRTSGNSTFGPHFTGFYETQAEFVEAFSTWLTALATAAGLASTYRAIETPDGRWTIQVTVGVGVTDVSIHVQSSQDGETSPQPADMQSDPLTADFGLALSLSAGDVVFPLWDPVWPDSRLVPRGHFDKWSGPRFAHEPSARATWPANRVYLDRPVSSDWTGLVVRWPDGAYTNTIETLDTSDNWIEIGRRPRHAPRGYADYRYGAWTTVPFRPTRSLARGTLETLRAGLVSAGPEYCNRAGSPFLTSADLASWAHVIAEAARGRPWLTQRSYTLTQSVDLEDLLQHEMRLYGVFPIVDSTGKIGVQSIEWVTSGGEPTNIDDELITVGWSSMQQGGQTVNTVILKTGYDPVEDEWLGREIVSKDMASYAQDHEDRELEIEPRSVAVIGDELIPPIDAADIMRRVSDVFGYVHNFIIVNVPWTLFHLRLGDPVSFSADHLPDYRTGARPTTEARGIVVSRRWALGEAHGVLRILAHGSTYRGYAPTARVLSESTPGSDRWELTVDHALYAPADAATDSFFEAGFKVRIVEYDSESPTIITGTVQSVDTVAHVIVVDFDSTWTPGGSTWELCFDSWDRVTDEQKVYAYIAVDNLLDGAAPANYAP